MQDAWGGPLDLSGDLALLKKVLANAAALGMDVIDDPANNIVYQAHQYFDRDSSGDYAQAYETEGAYAMVGVDRLKPFVDWLNANGDFAGLQPS